MVTEMTKKQWRLATIQQFQQEENLLANSEVKKQDLNFGSERVLNATRDAKNGRRRQNGGGNCQGPPANRHAAQEAARLADSLRPSV